MVLTITMAKVQAWEQLNDPTYAGQLKMGDYLDLLIRAGYTRSAAQKVANKRGWDRLQAGVVM